MERIKKWISGFLEDYFLAARTEIMPRGQATMRLALKQAGAEPDESWCLGQEKEFPDLVLEIALTSGGIDKLEVYRKFKVPEVWFWRRGRLTVHALRGDAYQEISASEILPGIDLMELAAHLDRPTASQAIREYRARIQRRH